MMLASWGASTSVLGSLGIGDFRGRKTSAIEAQLPRRVLSPDLNPAPPPPHGPKLEGPKLDENMAALVEAMLSSGFHQVTP